MEQCGQEGERYRERERLALPCVYIYICTGCLAGIGTMNLQRFLIQPNTSFMVFGWNRNHHFILV